MASIIPAILTSDLADLRQKLQILAPWAPAVHLDVADGKFVGNSTLTYEALAPVVHEVNLPVELHLMVNDPWPIAARAHQAGIAQILIHAETQANPSQFLAHLQAGWPLGLVFNLTTPWGVWETELAKLRVIMLMGIEPGWQGKPFDRRVLERLHFLERHYPEVDRAVDGGLSSTTISAVAVAGANQCVVGSAIWHSPNPQQAYQELSALVTKGLGEEELK